MEGNISELETYGFEQDERLKQEDIKEFSSNYTKVLTRREKRWKALDVTHMKKSGKEKRFVRKGIPSSLRPNVWLKVSGVDTKIAEQPTRYQTLLQSKLPQNTEYLIVTDVPRTFPENSHFRNLDGQDPNGLSQPLTKVLKAFAAAVPEIGYCQGLNFVAAILLLVVRNEEKAFWLLEYLITQVVPKGYYTPSMAGLKRDCQVLSDLVKEKIPAVAERLAAEEVSYIVICTKWFICMYCDTLPIETSIRVLDCLFFEGDKILFRVALTLIKLNSQELAKCSNFPKLLTTFQTMICERKTLFCHEFMEDVFKLPGSLPQSKIDKLRRKYAIQDGDGDVKTDQE